MLPRGLGQKIGAVLKDQGLMGLSSPFFILETQERAQRRSCLCAKYTEGLSGDAGLGRRAGWAMMKEEKETPVDLALAMSQAHYQHS